MNDNFNTTQTLDAQNIQISRVQAAPALRWGDKAIGKFANVSSLGNTFAFINISYADADVTSVTEADLKIWKYDYTTWTQTSPT